MFPRADSCASTESVDGQRVKANDVIEIEVSAFALQGCIGACMIEYNISVTKWYYLYHARV